MNPTVIARRCLVFGLSVGLTLYAGRVVSQPRRRRLIATLGGGSVSSSAAQWEAFRQTLRHLGYGAEDVAIESRWADGRYERLPGLAAELIALAPEVIVAGTGAAARAAMQQSKTIPIVMAVSGDPVASGLVASLARPGGNVTGVSIIQIDIVGKEIEFLKIVAPDASRIGVLSNPGNPAHAGAAQAALAAGRGLRIEVFSLQVSGPDEIGTAFASMSRDKTGAVLILADALLIEQAGRIAKLAIHAGLPSICSLREYATAGGLISYGPDIEDSFRRAAWYVDKILRGAKPADLPIEQPTKFELVINVRTANVLGRAVPQSLLARADEVIE